MPLGGIGTGTIALAGDGSLRQWQLHNVGNHRAFVPDTFFAIRAARPGRPDLYRSLEATPVDDPEPVPSVDDNFIPPALRARHEALPPLAESVFQAVYPAAQVRFEDSELPIGVRLHALSPFAPLDESLSSIPAALFEIELVNDGDQAATGWVGASAQNSVGWDGVSPIDGISSRCYGGNLNSVDRRAGWTGVRMENPALPSDHPGRGQLVLGSDADGINALAQHTGPNDLLAFLRGRYVLDQHLGARTPARSAGSGPYGGMLDSSSASAVGRTWDAALAVPYLLQSGERKRIRFWLTWNFPNRYVNFTQFGEQRDYGRSALWLGNHYSTEHSDAVSTADLVQRDWDTLVARTGDWVRALSVLEPIEAEHLAAQASLLRSTTCFRSEDGAFYGFEGVQGASTSGWADNGGSCPLNCTHVWNYEQALSRLFPRLERSMRDTEFDVLQAPDGHIPHRVIVPTLVRQLWDEPIGGPVEPALDGMLGTVLKTLREMQQGAPLEWLEKRWPALLRLLEHIQRKWDPENEGVLRGVQPSTFDIPVRGLNPYIGSYWLAALLATERLAQIVGDESTAHAMRDLFARGSRAYDDALWTGEYFRQELAPGESNEYAWGEGCLSDQLVGQWWAHQLGLGYILPEEHVKAALVAIVRNNFRVDFSDFSHRQRVYADGNDAGLLNCTWPHGGRPDHPVWYCDEVWTGVEYQVAAHCFFEGMHDEGRRILEAIWSRHDGHRRNPFNEVECGDHYARAMAGFSVFEARSGIRWDSSRGRIEISARPTEGVMPFFFGVAWGLATVGADGEATFDVFGGGAIS